MAACSTVLTYSVDGIFIDPAADRSYDEQLKEIATVFICKTPWQDGIDAF